MLKAVIEEDILSGAMSDNAVQRFAHDKMARNYENALCKRANMIAYLIAKVRMERTVFGFGEILIDLS